MWECGLKLVHLHKNQHHQPVTPYVGVWIETYFLIFKLVLLQSLLMWECGLKHRYPCEKS